MLYFGEEFVPVPGFETRYLVSRSGKVYSLSKNRLMHPEIDKDGYFRIGIYCNGFKKHKFVHQLVALTFIPNPDNLPQVNHINGQRQDNRVENLEWCTNSDNLRHAFKYNYGGYRDKALKNLNKINKYTQYILVVCIDETGNMSVFNSVNDCKRNITVFVCTGNITRAIRDNTKYKGYMIYGYKLGDLEQFANGEPLPDVLKAIPWEIKLKQFKESCNDYSSEGK